MAGKQKKGVWAIAAAGFAIVAAGVGFANELADLWRNLTGDGGQPSVVSFDCVIGNGTTVGEDSRYSTVARVGESEFVVAEWKTDYFAKSGYPKEERCKRVTKRFQTAFDNGSLTNLGTGEMNGQDVVCTLNTDGSCQDLLFTLQDEFDKPRAILEQLEGTLKGRAEGPVQNSSGKPQFRLEVNPEKAFGL